MSRGHHTCHGRDILFDVPQDVVAEVISNIHLSSDYNVLALAAPDIAEHALPGQFVMVKAGERLEPLLRRPFSVFEVLTENGRIVGLSLISKRIGPSTKLLFEAKPGDRIQCLGPLGRPFVPVAAPDEAWLVAGGVGLAPFATLAETLRARNIRTKLYYGARRAAELFYLDTFEKLGVELVLTTEDGSRGDPGLNPRSREWVADRGRVTVPLERDLKASRDVRRPHDLRLRSRAHARGGGQARRRAWTAVAGIGRARDGLWTRRLLQLRDSGQDTGGNRTSSDRASPVRCSAAAISCGNETRPTMDLSVRIGSLTLRNPLIAASGCFGTAPSTPRWSISRRLAAWPSRGCSSPNAKVILPRASSRRPPAC
jgi:NAD(P)H-flavin reductase